jgi:hypothetical protein
MLLLAMVVLTVWEARMGSAALLSTAECKEEVDMLTKECILSIRHKTNASPRCCELVRASHAQCVCPKATLTESMILEFHLVDAIRFVERCGLRVPLHFKCGSKFDSSFTFHKKKKVILFFTPILHWLTFTDPYEIGIISLFLFFFFFFPLQFLLDKVGQRGRREAG